MARHHEVDGMAQLRDAAEGRAVVTCYPDVYSPAAGVVCAWTALRERARAPRTYAAKKDVPRYVDGRFTYRSLDGFAAATSCTIDLDLEPYPTRDAVLSAFSSLAGFSYTSWASTETERRYRVDVVLSRFVRDLRERNRVWRALAVHAERHGLTPHLGSGDACHAWALPARHDGDSYDFLEFRGQPFSVDAALELIPAPPAPQPIAQPTVVDCALLDRASKWLKCCEPALQGSGGSKSLTWAACGLVVGFQLSRDDALYLLETEYNRRCQPPWRPKELVHAVDQVTKRPKTSKPRGWLLNGERKPRAA